MLPSLGLGGHLGHQYCVPYLYTKLVSSFYIYFFILFLNIFYLFIYIVFSGSHPQPLPMIPHPLTFSMPMLNTDKSLEGKQRF